MKTYKTLPLKEDKQIFIEMSNLNIDDTGMTKGWIRVSSKEGKHFKGRVKYYRDRPSDSTPSASISISPNPDIMNDSINITTNEKKQIFQFVIINYKKLNKMWFEGGSMHYKEWEQLLHSLKKIG
jgi:hypothetical protein